MAKLTNPPTKIPSWLDPEAEVTKSEPKNEKNAFVVSCMESCIELGCNPYQASGVVANAINESAWGQKYRGSNLARWKITKAYTDDNPHAPWFRAPGNKMSGDSAWEYYRVFPSVKDSLKKWLAHFVPQPDAKKPYPNYSYCGRLFWAGKPWFAELIHVGYKGNVTKRAPEKSIAEHEQLCKAALTRWAQGRLGTSPDGVVGRQTKKAANDYMAERGLTWSGEIDEALINALVKG